MIASHTTPSLKIPATILNIVFNEEINCFIRYYYKLIDNLSINHDISI